MFLLCFANSLVVFTGRFRESELATESCMCKLIYHKVDLDAMGN